MRLLLDTQIMLWWLTADTRLRSQTRERLQQATCLVSVASIWEVAIKHRLGKLPVDPVRFRDACVFNGASLLEIRDQHAIESGLLPTIHEDPFDRMIIAQARVEGLIAVSSDTRWREYDLPLLRA